MKRNSKRATKKRAVAKKSIRKVVAKSLPNRSPAQGVQLVDGELRRRLGLTTKQAAQIFRRGGDTGERKFMECCWCLWKAHGSELIGPFVEAAFNFLPAKSRCILFERMLTIVYVAQDTAVKQVES